MGDYRGRGWVAFDKSTGEYIYPEDLIIVRPKVLNDYLRNFDDPYKIKTSYDNNIESEEE